MKWLAVVWATWIAWVPVTFLFGRVFCRYVCPLGLSQSLVGLVLRPRKRVRRVCSRLPRGKAQRCVNLAFLALYLALPAGYLLHPWGIFGRVLVLFVPGIVFFAAILVLAAFGNGRIWCNWVCPLGTVFDAVARYAWRGDKIGRGCANCRKCFPKPEEKDPPAAGNADGVTRRDTLKGVALLAAADKIADGGFAEVSLPGIPSGVPRPLPPGAIDAKRFSYLCVGCGLCAAKCPGECLRPSASLLSLGRPEMDFRRGYCLSGCTKCSDVCPTAAILGVAPGEKRTVRNGLAVWKKSLCIRATEEAECSACVRKCPVKAIHLVGGFPVVDENACVGCGACEHVCPARPEPAIVVEGFSTQRIVKPIGEGDLVAEMRTLVENGKSVVAAKDGVIFLQLSGHGFAPALEACGRHSRELAGATVMDRVVGLPAAALYAKANAAKVFALVMSRDAEAFLRARGIGTGAVELVRQIAHRGGRGGSCPFAERSEGLSTVDEITKAIGKVTET